MVDDKKGLFGLIIVVIILFIVGFFWFYGEYKNNTLEDQNLSNICSENNSCVKIQTTCCPCESGGKEKCVLANEIEKYKKELENCPSGEELACISLYNCGIESCDCVNGNCSEIS
jgi:hypothetical protein